MTEAARSNEIWGTLGKVLIGVVLGAAVTASFSLAKIDALELRVRNLEIVTARIGEHLGVPTAPLDTGRGKE